MNIEKKASLSLLLASFLWGFAFIGLDYAFLCGWQPFPLLMCRGLFGGLFVFLFCYKKKWWQNKRILTLGFISGVLYFIGYAFQTFGQQLSSVPNTAFITSVYILIVPIISSVFLKRKIANKIYVACVVALVGIGILTLDNTFTLHLGDIYLLLCALFFALQIIYNEKCGEVNDVLSVTCVQLLTMGICSLICMPLSGQVELPSIGWMSVLYLSIFSTGITSVLQLFGQSHVEPSKASLFLCLESPIATVLSILLLNEPITLSLVLGGGLILSAVLLAESKKKSSS